MPIEVVGGRGGKPRQFRVYKKVNGKKTTLGTYDTRAAAEKRNKQYLARRNSSGARRALKTAQRQRMQQRLQRGRDSVRGAVRGLRWGLPGAVLGAVTASMVSDTPRPRRRARYPERRTVNPHPDLPRPQRRRRSGPPSARGDTPLRQQKGAPVPRPRPAGPKTKTAAIPRPNSRRTNVGVPRSKPAGPRTGNAGPPRVAPPRTSPQSPRNRKPNYDNLSFSQAFAKARERQKKKGNPAKGTFTWRGKRYTTRLRGEKRR